MGLGDLPLLDFIPALSPHMRRPTHMADWCAMIERTIREPVRACNSKPTRHHKTWTTLHGIIWILLNRPTWRVVLLTHEHSRAEWLGEQGSVLRLRAGIEPVRGQDTKRNWATKEGGGLLVTAVGQSVLGADCQVLIADDPITEMGFGDPAVRDQVDEAIAFLTSRCLAIYPGKSTSDRGSVLLIMSRGDLDDPIARRVARGWENTTSPAILEEGTIHERPFAPDLFSLEALHQIRQEMAQQDPSLRRWNSQWMNNPLAWAEGFFEGETVLIGEVPHDAPRVFGIDCAFTQGKKSDYCAFVEMVDVGQRLAIPRVIRHRRGLSYAIETLEQLHQEHPTARFVTYASGQEIGIYHDIFRQTNGRIAIEIMPARWNKATRASKCAQAWRQGLILVRLGAPWTGTYLGEMHSFSGSETGVDDQVDATVSAYDAFQLGRAMADWGNRFAFGTVSI